MRSVRFVGVMTAVLSLPLGGCIFAAGVAATAGIPKLAEMSNDWAEAQLEFGTLSLEKFDYTDLPGDSIVVSGFLTYRGHRIKKDAQFYPLQPSHRICFDLLDARDAVLVTVAEPFRTWDGDDLISALPIEKPIKFEARSEIPHNVFAMTVAATMNQKACERFQSG